MLKLPFLNKNKPKESLFTQRQGFPYGEVLHEMITKHGENVIFRRYKPSDSGRKIMGINRKAMKSNKGYVYLKKIGWDRDLLQINDVYMSGRNDFIVAEMKGKIVGFGAIAERKDLGESIAEFVRDRVSPKYFGRGIGLELSKLREALAISYGFTMLCAVTSTNQKQSMHNFEKLGFAEYGREPVLWSKVPGCQNIYYKKEISGRGPEVISTA
jgi:N-acetylglutamate synthase-like GNAT family acetyltransferase